jgi:SAM-dependent methyltransferase
MPTYRAIPSFYDDEYADLHMLQRDVGWLMSRLPKRASEVLMLACGTGRAAIPIAQAGHRVLGVDIDDAMLAISRAKAEFAGLPTKQLGFKRHDLLAMKLGRRFDSAAILFNSFLMFTTLEEQDRVLSNVHRALKQRGRLFIDVFNPDLARIAEQEAINADVRMFFSRELGVGVQRTTHIRMTKRPQVRETIFEYRWFDANGRAKKRTVKFDLTYFFPRELTMLLERNGFEVFSIAGDYDGGAVDADSGRLLVEARKQ